MVAGGIDGETISTTEVAEPLASVVEAVVVYTGKVPDVTVMVDGGIVGTTISTMEVAVPLTVVARTVV